MGMPCIRFMQDSTFDRGRVLRPATNVLCNNVPVGIHPSPIKPHPGKPKPKHIIVFTLTGSGSVSAQNAPVLRSLGSTTCGFPLAMGSTDVIVG
jgi:hypothetical protein